MKLEIIKVKKKKKSYVQSIGTCAQYVHGSPGSLEICPFVLSISITSGIQSC